MQNMDAGKSGRTYGEADVVRELVGLLGGGPEAEDAVMIGVVTQVSPLLVRFPGKAITVGADGTLTATDLTPVSATKWTTMSLAITQKVILVRLPGINAWACVGRYVP